MKSITMRNFPDDLLARLKESARRNRRSVNQEGLLWLERGLDRLEAMDDDMADLQIELAAKHARRMRGGEVPKGAMAIRMMELGEPE